MGIISLLNQSAKPANAVQTSNFDRPTTIEQNLVTAADTNASAQVDAVKESFWAQTTEEPDRYSKLYPYQLMMVEVFSNEVAGYPTVSYKPVPGWTFTFPLPPESFEISIPFAVTTNVTLGGIIEEHNGAPIRYISARGSTGYLPLRSAGTTQQGPNLLVMQSIAGGTINQINNIEGNVTNLVSSATGQALQNLNLHTDSEFQINPTITPNAPLPKTTGQYQWRRMQRFLEAYASLSKTKEGRNYRLAFAIWKDQSVYLVTTNNFRVRKESSSPMEYVYDIQFKAYRRIILEAGTFQYQAPLPIRRNPGVLAKVLNTIRNARKVLQSVGSLSAAVLGDIDHLLFEPLREVSLVCVDALGAQMSLAELPDDIKKSCKESWISSIGGNVNNLNETVANTKSALTDGVAANKEYQSITTNDFSQKRLSLLTSHPALNPFDNATNNFDLMSKIDVADLELSPAVTSKINIEVNRVQGLKRKDFEIRRNQVRLVYDRFAASLGLTNAAYNDTYQLKTVTKVKNPTKSDWEALGALNDSLESLNAFTATADNEPSSVPNSLEVMAGLYRRSGQAFKVPRSKFAVPFPYGSTLEDLAKTYLGHENRWIEIATLNGLKEPFIDEVGFALPLLTNGVDNQVVISATDKIYVNQQVWIKSNTITRTVRRVQGINVIGNSMTLTLDGTNDLGLFEVADGAILEAFTPDTINSRQLIYIPSDVESDINNYITKDIPGLNPFDPYALIGGIDLLLTSDNDLVVTPTGDTPLSFGIANIIQNLRIGISVTQGSLPLHRDFGLPLEVGMNTADVDANNVLAAIKKMIANDTSFSKLDFAKVIKTGPALTIDVGITPIGTEHMIPINYKVLR